MNLDDLRRLSHQYAGDLREGDLEPMTKEQLIDQADAQIERTRGASYTEYKIVGELPDVFEAIATIFHEYDPRGYGTAVKKIWLTSSGYEASVWRANSCD
jgi:hypothetical protein